MEVLHACVAKIRDFKEMFCSGQLRDSTLDRDEKWNNPICLLFSASNSTSFLIYWKKHLGQEEIWLQLEAPIKPAWVYHTIPTYLCLRNEGLGHRPHCPR